MAQVSTAQPCTQEVCADGVAAAAAAATGDGDALLTRRVAELKDAGNAEVKTKNYAKAADVYSEAISVLAKAESNSAVCPGMHGLFGNRCLCYIKLRKFAEARCDAEEAISRNGRYAKGFYRLALCQKSLADLAGAWESIDKAVALDPEDTDILQLKEEID